VFMLFQYADSQIVFGIQFRFEVFWGVFCLIRILKSFYFREVVNCCIYSSFKVSFSRLASLRS
jgi:hypothetical protein